MTCFLYINPRSHPNAEALKECEDYYKKPIKFLLTPNWKDNHASTLIHILNPRTHKILVSLFLNSNQTVEYTKYIQKRFEISQNTNPALFQFFPHLDIEKQKNSLLINSENRVACFVNPDSQSGDYDEKIGTLLKNPNVDYMFVIKEEVKIPFIDVSHHLQLQEHDENCALYGINFINAITEMLGNNTIADKVYTLANKINSNDNQEAKNEIINIFQNELKTYLPCYYDEHTKSSKSEQEIKKFHLKQRWNVGNLAISNINSLESNLNLHGI